MKTAITGALALLVAASSAQAIQETFTTAGPLNCSAVSVCVQNTADNLFTLSFIPTYPTSAPSPSGFNVNEQAIEVASASGGLLDLNGLQINLTGSDFYNGVNFLGAIQLEVQDATSGAWSYVTQWSTWVASSKGIYVLFNGRAANAPLIRGVRAIRLSGINGATAFRIGMLNLTAR
ncbi:hypothetical protein KF840_25530 [bacterium]|nr:hypothetical protein [bacterium]